jgi:hypothetical protein
MTAPDIDAVVDLHFKINSFDRRFDSPSNRASIAKRMKSFGLGVHSDTGVARAIKELVTEEIISRADGGNAESDARVAAAAEKARLDRIASAPLTERDFDAFSRMHPSEVAQKFWSDRAFQVRYRAASAAWGFVLPEPPQRVEQVTDETDTSEYSRLTAKEYFQIPADRVRFLYKSNSSFKRNFDRLVRQGKV